MSRRHPSKSPRPGVDKQGRTPLHYAAVNGDEAEIQRLCSQGANPNAQDDHGWTPLHFAAQTNSAPATAALLSQGAELERIDSQGNTPLLKAVFHSRGDGAVLTLLREAGANPDTRNHFGVSPRSLATTIANFDVAQFFEDWP